MASSESSLGEVQVFSDPQFDSVESANAVIAVLRQVQREADITSSLLGDEEEVVSQLLSVLRDLDRPLTGLKLDRSTLPFDMEGLEEAHMLSNGKLIMSGGDGVVYSLDLAKESNRDLLVNIVGDIIPKLKNLADQGYQFEPREVQAPAAEQFVIEPTDIEPDLVEPEPVVVEPPVVEELPILKEQVVEPEVQAPEEQEEAPEPPDRVIIEEPQAPEVREEEPKPEIELPESIIDLPIWEPISVEEEKVEEPHPEKIERLTKAAAMRRGNQISRLRMIVGRQKESTAREMERVRRLRDAHIRKLRQSTGIYVEPEEEEGLMDRFKGWLKGPGKKRK